MADTLKDFLVGIGFAVDPASAKKVEDQVAKTEATVTKTSAAESAKRVQGEQAAASGRIGLVKALGQVLLLEQQKNADAQEEKRKSAAEKAAKADQVEIDKQQKRQDEAEKRSRDRREKALKEVQSGALKLAAFALKTVAAVQATALGVVYATDKAAQAMERLNYQSRLIGSTPQAMTAAGYAASQLGSSVEAANTALSAMGTNFRTLPGYADAFSRLTGKSAKDAQGNLRNTADLMADLGDKLREIEKTGGKYGRAQALAQASFYGIDDPNLVNAIEDPRYRQLEQERVRRQGAIGADTDDAAESGTKFEQSMRRLKDVIDAIQTKVSTGLFKDLQPQLDKLSAWGEANGSKVADILTRVADDLVKLSGAIIDRLAKVDWIGILTGIESFAKSFDALATKYFGETGTVAVAFTAFGLVLTNTLLGPLRTALSLAGKLGPALAVFAGANWLADHDKNTGAAYDKESTGEAITRFLDPGIADRIYGQRDDAGNRVGEHGDAPVPAEQTAPAQGKAGGSWWNWLKGTFGVGTAKAAEQETPDLRVRDAILSTDKGVRELVEVTKHAAAGNADAGVSSGGLGGSGHHFDGGATPGARLSDRSHGRRGTGTGSASGVQSDAAAPGANGFGTIDAPYRASVDAKGERGILSPRELFDYLKGHGATDNEATMLTGAAGNESSFNPHAVHDGGNGYGLWGHNIHGRIDMRGMSWQQQADAALAEAKRDYAGRINAARTPQDLADAEMHYERPRGFRSDNPRGGDNYTGRLHTIDRFARTFGTLGNTPASPVAGPGGSTAESTGEKIAGMKSAGLLTDEQCVTLAMAAVGVKKGQDAGGNVHDWRKGDGAEAGTLRPGTPVATFLDRQGRETDRYADGGAGTEGAHLDHAGVFQKYVADAYGKRIGMTIAEQYRGSHGVHLKDYLFGKGYGEGNGSNYHAVLGPDGKPLGGERNPMSASAAPHAVPHPDDDRSSRAKRLAYTPSPSDKTPVKVAVTEDNAAKLGKTFASSFPSGTVPHGSNSLAALHREWFEAKQNGDLDRARAHLDAMRLVQRARAGKLFPMIHHPHGITPSVMASIDNSRRRGDATLNYAPQFHSHGSDHRTMMADARRDASRGSADLMRNLMTTET